MFEKFSNDARRCVVTSQDEARALDHNYIGTEHLLIASLSVLDEHHPVQQFLQRIGITADTARQAVAETVGRGQKPSGDGALRFTPRGKRVLELAHEESVELGNPEVCVEHVLLGIVREGEGAGAQVLQRVGNASATELRAGILAAITTTTGRALAVHRNRTPAATEILDRATELTEGGPVGSHHILQALTGSPDSAANQVLVDLGVDPGELAERIGALDLESTSDMTPLQRAVRRMRVHVDGDEAHVVFSDEETVGRARRVVALNGGADVTGKDRLAGAFATLWQATSLGLGTTEMILTAAARQAHDAASAASPPADDASA